MNETTIENILLRAPQPAAPSDLFKKLRAEIALPAKKAVVESREWRSPLRRWFPALAFGVLMLSCAIMIAVQASWSANLKRQNEALRAVATDLPQLRERHAALENAAAQRDEVAQLRKDNEELHQLQTEVAQLRKLPQQIQQLQNENQRLSAAPAPSATNGATFFDQARAEAERIQCVNHLKQIGLAFRVWAGDNQEKYPTTFNVMSNELSTTKILVCPSDKQRASFAGMPFAGFENAMSSYQLSVQPDDQTYPECIIAKCPTHHNYLLADGSVQTVNPEKVREMNRDGRWYLERVDAGNFNERTVAPIK
jgi:TolA-binding protein